MAEPSKNPDFEGATPESLAKALLRPVRRDKPAYPVKSRKKKTVEIPVRKKA